MTTARQIEANKRNARSSTGPRTQEGKAASRTNALQHGLTAQQVVIVGEDPAEYDTLRRSMQLKYASNDPLAAQLVDRLTEQLWRLRRVPVLENALLSWLQRAELLKDQLVPKAGPMRMRPSRLPVSSNTSSEPIAQSASVSVGACEFDSLHSLGRTIQKALGDEDYLLKLSRYQTTLIRDFERLLGQLFRVLERERSTKGAMPDAPRL